MIDWRYWLTELVVFAGNQPFQFIQVVLLILSPLFALSAYFSWQLAKQIDKEDKDRKKKEKRTANIAKAQKSSKNKNSKKDKTS